MNKKRNVAYIKPEDPEFLKVLKRQAGYDDKNHKFDELQNAEDDFVDDEDCEKPQVVVLKEGDLTAEQAEEEQARLDKLETNAKADLAQRVIFKPKPKPDQPDTTKRKHHQKSSPENKNKKSRQLLSFGDDEDESESL